MSTFLRLENVGKRFGEHVVLSSVSLDVEQGEFLTLLGESGSGKTTVTRLLQRLNASYEGMIKIDGMGEDLDAGTAYDVTHGLFVAFGVYQVAAAQAEDGAVGQ